MTAERFITNPSNQLNVDRLYKTGDLARYLSNGNLEYVGRIDNQVKLRGFRIELGEIEAVLKHHRQVLDAVALVREKQLVAYVVTDSEQAITQNELALFLKEKLPNYMMPAAFVMVEALPLLPNGKVDRRSLLKLNQTRPELVNSYQAPQTELERKIANIWQEVLQLQEVGINDNFFDLGGHSLLLVEVHSKLQTTLQQDLPLVDMFQYPTISYLSQYLTQNSSIKTALPKTEQLESRSRSTKRRKKARQKHRAEQQKRFQ